LLEFCPLQISTSTHSLTRSLTPCTSYPSTFSFCSDAPQCVISLLYLCRSLFYSVHPPVQFNRLHTACVVFSSSYTLKSPGVGNNCSITIQFDCPFQSLPLLHHNSLPDMKHHPLVLLKDTTAVHVAWPCQHRMEVQIPSPSVFLKKSPTIAPAITVPPKKPAVAKPKPTAAAKPAAYVQDGAVAKPKQSKSRNGV
jgi:hypothetical protein